MSELLKPCPWCGQEPVITKIEGQTSVRCESQHCNILPTSMWSDGELEVFEQWNTRAVDTKMIDWLISIFGDSNCGEVWSTREIMNILKGLKQKREKV